MAAVATGEAWPLAAGVGGVEGGFVVAEGSYAGTDEKKEKLKSNKSRSCTRCLEFDGFICASQMSWVYLWYI